MRLLHLLIREVLYRKSNFILAILAVTIAIASLLGSICVLEIHTLHTHELLAQKQAETQDKLATLNDEIRKAMLELGFNLLILPEDQNLRDWHTDDYASKYMPEAYVTQLAESGIVTVRHFLPSLQQKIEWPEIKRTIILIGTRGEVPNLYKDPRNPLVHPVPVGTIVLGHELHQSQGWKVGDCVKLLGREFTVHECHNERGNKDDIAAWISLAEAQELFDKPGLINGILALKCLCMGSENIAKLREKIAQILPHTQAIEVGSRVVAREEARLKLKEQTREMIRQEKESRLQLKSEREGLISIAVPLIMLVCVIWMGYLGFVNAKDREKEIGILRTLGYRSGQVLWLFLLKSLVIGLVGGCGGGVVGSLGGYSLGVFLEGPVSGISATSAVFRPVWFAAALVAASLLTILAGWIPALMAARQDPAQVLQNE
jgi:putative ABC transport system permease protein